ncbi:MAG: endonuclease MutS2 [Dehalococcoidales bacterium]|nr:endonuclease MutS2 [Dehalococcoidales bacterium]
MDEKSLEMLEFPRIREILADYTSFSASRELAMNIKPLQDHARITLLLQQTAEARSLLALDRGFSIGSARDIRDKAKLATLEGILDPPSLLEVQQTLNALHDLRRYLKSISTDFPLLWSVAEEIVDLPQIEKDIASCIDPAGDVLDNASPELAGIRAQLRNTRAQILEKLEGIVKSPRGERVLQEDVITERDGRYVLLVKIENRHDLKGIVHDISNTGVTVFMEPTATVGLGNAIRELVVEERHEIEKVLRLLTAEVGAHADEITRSIELTADLDLILAKARYAIRINAVEPHILEPSADGKKNNYIKLVEAHHPLLGEKAVPFSLELGEKYSVLVITGPNTGGKTVTLKTIGLLNVMAQSGLPIPADGSSQLPIFNNVFADIGDEQSIEQTLSTFSWHIQNIVHIIGQADGRSLVLLDELGTSTDPAEGSALARALLRHFLSKSVLTVATTHFTDLKAFAHTTPGLNNASLEFDAKTLTPTYRLTFGIPGGSNAIATAARLGIPAEIINDARSLLSGNSQELESLLANLMEEKQKIAVLERDLVVEKEKLQRRSAEMDKELQRLKTEERRNLQAERDAIVQEAAELHKEIRQAATELRKEKTSARLEEAKKSLDRVRKEIATERWQPPPGTTAEEEDTTIKIGDTVRLKEAGLTGTVLTINEDSQEIEVQAGVTKMRLGLNGVVKSTPAPDKFAPAPKVPAARRVAMELDLRGKRADEVEPILDTYLNDAAQSNLSEVRIIHGIATGTVRAIVRDFLKNHPLSISFRTGRPDEGGDGVTVVKLQ